MSNNSPQTIAQAFEQLDIAFMNLSEAIKIGVSKYVASEQRVMLLKTTSQSNLMLSREVLTLVSETLDIPIEQLIGKNRTQYVVDARSIYFYIVRKVAKIDISLTDLGNLMNKSHATVLHACQHVSDLMLTEKAFEAKVNKCIDAYNLVFTTK